MVDEQRFRKQTRVQTKFLIGLACIMLIFSALVSITIYLYAKRTLEHEAFEKSELVMTAMEANRSYVREVLRPQMYKTLADDTFILEAMSSSFISRSVMERFGENLTDFSYRRVAINARNPDYEANGIEAEMIRMFQDNPQVDEWQGIVNLEGNKYYMRFQPEYFKQSCTYCHGDPADAPQKILELYGDDRGFYRTPGDVSGVISVGLPVDVSLAQIKETAITVFMAGIPLVLFLFTIISIFFNRFIVQNLQHILAIFRTSFKDEPGIELPEKQHHADEIRALNEAARSIASHLKQNRQKLMQYTERLLQSKELLQSVFDGITDPVLLLDNQSRIKLVNAEFRKRYGVSLSSVIGLTPLELKLDQCCPLKKCDQIFTQMPNRPVSQEIRVESGEIFHVYFYPVSSGGDNLDNLVCYVKDITEQKKLETRIQQTEKLVSLGQLAAGIAHEINNPLGVILCHIDLIKDETELTEDARNDLAIIEKHAGNCKTIIADLLNFAHQQQTVKQHGCINDIVQEAVSMIETQLQKSDITIQLDLAENIASQLLDFDKIKQVMLNLVLNSSHAIGTKGRIIVRTESDTAGGSTLVHVDDSGPGVPESVIGKIFDPFFTTKPPGKGTGLGLSVSYGIIKEHKGEIRVETSPVEGLTRFTISLPILEDTDA